MKRTMKRRLPTCLLLLLLVASGLRAQVQYTTESPRVDDVNDRDVIIKRVELTDQYTIVYMKFEAPDVRRAYPAATGLSRFPCLTGIADER